MSDRIPPEPMTPRETAQRLYDLMIDDGGIFKRNDPTQPMWADRPLMLRQGDRLPDPADVPEGQAWAVSIDDMEETAGFKASGFGWICYRELGGTTKVIPSDRITLVSRLVPAPRQIITTTPEYRAQGASRD